MKKIFLYILLLFVFTVFAKFPANYSDWRFTDDFKVYHDAGLTADDAASAVYGKPVRNLKCKTISSLAKPVDFNTVFGYEKPVSQRTAVIVNRIETFKTGRIQFGVGADWHIVAFINGKKVFDTREMGGNGPVPVKCTDHVIDVELPKGMHNISFWVSSGNTTWGVSVGKVPYTKVVYPPAELKYGPYITDVASDSAIVSFVTKEPAPSGIALRKAGANDFNRFWSHSWYQIDPDKRVHRIEVDGLEPDTVYEYKIIYLERPDNREVSDNKMFRLRTAAKKFKPFKIFVTGDLQYLDDKQCDILNKYMSTNHAASSDFFISLGDSRGVFNSFEKDIFDVTLKAVLEKSRNEKNILLLRGNHEYRGKQTYLFKDYFALKNGKSFGVYIYNDVAFVILDCGNAAKRSMANTRHYSAYDLPELLMKEQRKELAKGVASLEYKKAKYRVVLAHGAVYGAENTLSPYARKLISGIIDEKDITLWLGGHIHHYRRTVPGKAGFYGFEAAKPAEIAVLNGNYPFLTMIIDGPGSNKPHSGHTVEFLANGIKVNSFFEDGKVFDSFELNCNGKLVKEKIGSELKYYNTK